MPRYSPVGCPNTRTSENPCHASCNLSLTHLHRHFHPTLSLYDKGPSPTRLWGENSLQTSPSKEAENIFGECLIPREEKRPFRRLMPAEGQMRRFPVGNSPSHRRPSFSHCPSPLIFPPEEGRPHVFSCSPEEVLRKAPPGALTKGNHLQHILSERDSERHHLGGTALGRTSFFPFCSRGTPPRPYFRGIFAGNGHRKEANPFGQKNPLVSSWSRRVGHCLARSFGMADTIGQMVFC